VILSTSESGVRDHAGYLIVICIRDDHALTELSLRLGELRRKDVARLGLVPLDFAGSSLGEALGRARMGLQFGHCFLDFGSACPYGRQNQLEPLWEQGSPRLIADLISISQDGF
jgi:hypothetical protein